MGRSGLVAELDRGVGLAMAWPVKPLPDPIPRADGRSGNRCGHNPEAPLLFSALEFFKNACDRGIPKILQTTIRDLDRYFSDPDKVFPSLAHIRDRKQRSERREACQLVLCCYLLHMDLASMRSATFHQNGTVAEGLGYEFVSEATGLSVARVQRAIADMKDSPLLSVHPLVKKLEDCAYQGFNAVVKIGEAVFDAVGRLVWLRHERRKAAERRRRKQDKAARPGRAALRAAAQQVGARPAPKPSQEAPRSASSLPTAIGDALAEIKAALRGQGPPKPSGEED